MTGSQVDKLTSEQAFGFSLLVGLVYLAILGVLVILGMLVILGFLVVLDLPAF